MRAASRCGLRRIRAESNAEQPQRSLWACVPDIPPERCRGAPTAPERCALPAADFTPEYARARWERLVRFARTRICQQKFFAAKIIDGLTFEWYIQYWLVLCCVRSLQRTRFAKLYFDSVKEPCYFLFWIACAARGELEQTADVCEWLFRLPTWKVALDEAVAPISSTGFGDVPRDTVNRHLMCEKSVDHRKMTLWPQ